MAEGLRWWERPIGSAVRGRIIGLLRRAPASVEELAAALGVTDNAVRVHLQTLEREGVVEQAGSRRDGSVGKPAVIFRIARDAEPALSSAYAPLLTSLLASLSERLKPAEVRSVLRDAGKRLAAAQPHTAERASLESRARSGAELLSALGGETKVSSEGNTVVIEGMACPLSAAVREQPDVCLAVEELLEGATGAHVKMCCEHGDNPRCRFVIRRTA